MENKVATNLLQALTNEVTEYKPNWFQGFTDQGLKLEYKVFRNKFRVIAGNALPEEILDQFQDVLDHWGRGTRWIQLDCETAEQAELELTNAVEVFDLIDYAPPAPKQYGVTFKETDFENYGERDFMAAITQATKKGWKQYFPTGRNLVHEYVAAADSRIDAVELDENGKVTTVIECQSGIQNGEYLDAVHFEKSISRYPHLTGAKRVVIIAGGYTEAQLATFAQLPFEIIALTTTVVEGQIELI